MQIAKPLTSKHETELRKGEREKEKKSYDKKKDTGQKVFSLSMMIFFPAAISEFLQKVSCL